MNAYDKTVLNDVTSMLMDSKKGYETCSNLVGDLHPLTSFFQRRARERESIIIEIQDALKRSGYDLPEEGGTIPGTLHRVFTHFTSVFRGDEKAALVALQDGEDFLAERLEERLGDSKLCAETQAHLRKALASARDGERLAVQLGA